MSHIKVGTRILISDYCAFGYRGQTATVYQRASPGFDHIESPGYWFVLENGHRTYFPNCARVIVISIDSDEEEETDIESGED